MHKTIRCNKGNWTGEELVVSFTADGEFDFAGYKAIFYNRRGRGKPPGRREKEMKARTETESLLDELINTAREGTSNGTDDDRRYAADLMDDIENFRMTTAVEVAIADHFETLGKIKTDQLSEYFDAHARIPGRAVRE